MYTLITILSFIAFIFIYCALSRKYTEKFNRNFVFTPTTFGFLISEFFLITGIMAMGSGEDTNLTYFMRNDFSYGTFLFGVILFIFCFI